jgi:hypothetical protein
VKAEAGKLSWVYGEAQKRTGTVVWRLPRHELGSAEAAVAIGLFRHRCPPYACLVGVIQPKDAAPLKRKETNRGPTMRLSAASGLRTGVDWRSLRIVAHHRSIGYC